MTSSVARRSRPPGWWTWPAAGLPAPITSDPETERYRLFDAVASWLGDASRRHPLLLVLDDLQWAAKPTLLLLRHIARSA
ncbi:MAG: AAA family ATPase, partial [Acidimicrobiia bacterium]